MLIDARILDSLVRGNIDPENLIVLAEVGSNAHGTYIPSDQEGIDDVDYMGAYLPSVEDLIGLRRGKDVWTDMVDELDLTFYSVEKLTNLWLKANPNTLGLLWQEQVVHGSTVFTAFTEINHAFASKRAFPAFAGYATSQLKKMTASEKNSYAGYMGARRKRLVDKHGYDTKNASHLVRLLSMCIEFMQEGVMYVDRTGRDAQQLVAIKQGEYSLDGILDLSRDLFARAEVARDESRLPDEPDRDLIEATLVRVHREYLRST